MKYKLKKQYRLQSHDYSKPGDYFVTICSYKRKHLFSSINNSKITLTSIGKIIKDNLQKTVEKYVNTIINKYAIMPNHIHKLINITKQRKNVIHHVLRQKETIKNNPMQTKYATLGGIVRHFKARSTYFIHRKTGFKGQIWQPKFHDRIISSDKEFYNVYEYIELNPLNWERDKYYNP